MRLKETFWALMIVGLALSGTAKASGSYRIIDLGTWKGTAFTATDINGHGTVAGHLDIGSDMYSGRLAVWSNGRIRNMEATTKRYDGRNHLR